MKSQLFQYAIIWHPTEKQIKDDGKKSELIVALNTVLAPDAQTAGIMAGMEIPVQYKDQIDQIQIALRPF